MNRLFNRVRRPVAQVPGTMEFTGEQKVERMAVQVIDYDSDSIDIRTVDDVEECFPYKGTGTVTWINIHGLHDTEALEAICRHFGLHPLVREDIVNTHQRPKLEDYQDYLYIVGRMLRAGDGGSIVESEQLSIVVGPDFVLSFQERSGDVFEPVRERLRKGKGRIRGGGADYLGYALVDAVVDNYFLLLEGFGDQIETLEEELLDHATIESLQKIHHLKREMVLLRRSVWPLREVVAGLSRSESELIGDKVEPFLRDLYDHVIQVIDAVESFRDMLSSLQDLYMSSVSNHMNDIMKVLTIFASIFVPLTFIAGVYGMNFEYIPELGWRWSYAVFWCVILAAGGTMLAFFRRRKWL